MRGRPRAGWMCSRLPHPPQTPKSDKLCCVAVVVPTHVRVNRKVALADMIENRRPDACGGEPKVVSQNGGPIEVLLTHVWVTQQAAVTHGEFHMPLCCPPAARSLARVVASADRASVLP